MISQILAMICLASVIRLLGYSGNALWWERFFAIPIACLFMMYPPAVYFTVPECGEPSLIHFAIFTIFAIIVFACKGRFEYIRRCFKND